MEQIQNEILYALENDIPVLLNTSEESASEELLDSMGLDYVTVDASKNNAGLLGSIGVINTCVKPNWLNELETKCEDSIENQILFIKNLEQADFITAKLFGHIINKKGVNLYWDMPENIRIIASKNETIGPDYLYRLNAPMFEIDITEELDKGHSKINHR